jgi:CelD/BcsL family acetyltransferase involved in cellulose biosynthesis
MHGLIVPLSELEPEQELAWRDLARRALEPNPMAEPGCALPAAHNLPYGSDSMLLAAQEDGRFFAATPICTPPGSKRLRPPIVTTDIRRMTYLGTPLVDRDRSIEALRVLLTTLCAERRRRRWLCFTIKWMNKGPVASMMEKVADELGLPVYVTSEFEQPFISRHEDLATYTATQSSQRLHQFRRKGRRLSESLGEELTVVNRAKDETAVDEYIELEAAGYKTGTGVAMTTHPGEAECFRDMCRRFAGEDRLHLLCLQTSERIVAMQISIEAGAGLFLIKVSYDESYAHFSPGILLHLKAMEYFHSQTNAEWIRVCANPDNETMLKMYPERRCTTTPMVGLGGIIGNGLVRALPTSDRIARPLFRRIVSRGRRQPAAGSAEHP